jgi:hypothetical protein
MGKPKAVKSEVVPVIETKRVDIDSDHKRAPSYVVVRDGFRVSDREYETQEDPYAVVEKAYWEKIANTHSHGEKVEIVQYDSKKHRIW